jgi:hypothetical protein
MPTMKTTGNSRPLAWCRVISVVVKKLLLSMAPLEKI